MPDINVKPLPERADQSRAHLEMIARESLRELAEEVTLLARDLPKGLVDAVRVVLTANQPIIVSGVGKSGIAAHKIASTMRSSGTPAMYLHAGDAAHGDIGITTIGGCAILLSWSGETQELMQIIPVLRERQYSIVLLTGSDESSLASVADIVVACQMRSRNGSWLVPTTATGLMIALGDALAQMVRAAKAIPAQEIAKLHPGGAIGDRASQRVGDVMHTRRLPVCQLGDSSKKVAATMSEGGLGAVLVMAEDELRGIITDGDIRRAIERGEAELTAEQLMTPEPQRVAPDELLMVALDKMHKDRITVLVVSDFHNEVIGLLSIHD